MGHHIYLAAVNMPKRSLCVGNTAWWWLALATNTFIKDDLGTITQQINRLRHNLQLCASC